MELITKVHELATSPTIEQEVWQDRYGFTN